MTFLDDLPDTLPTLSGSEGPMVPKKTALERLKDVQNEILVENLRIIEDVTHFRDIEPQQVVEGVLIDGTTEPPQEWIDQVGEVEAKKRLRIARAAWMNAKDAPVGLAIAKSVVVGITKALATVSSGPKVLNVAVVQMTAPLPQFKVRDMTKELESK